MAMNPEDQLVICVGKSNDERKTDLSVLKDSDPKNHPDKTSCSTINDGQRKYVDSGLKDDRW
jgi:hypothetical protein